MGAEVVDAFTQYFASIQDDDERRRLLARVKMTALQAAPEGAFAADVRSMREYLDTPIEIPPSLVWPTIAVRGEITTTLGRSGKGKRNSDDTPVLTVNGWRRIDALRVGDELIDPDGGTSTVTGVFPSGVQETYRVTFSDGTSTKCGPEHLWLASKWNNCKPRVRALEDMMGEVKNKRADRLWFVPITQPCEHPPVALVVAPYILGVLLGDGGISNGNVNFTVADDEITERVGSLLPEGCHLRKCGQHPLRTRILGPSQQQANPAIDELRRLKLWGLRSWEKFVPEECLTWSIEQRQELLAGLLDTDGGLGGTGAYFWSSSLRLAEGVASLARSLGGVATITSRAPRGEKWFRGKRAFSSRIQYTVSLRVPENPFRLSRKADGWRRTRICKAIDSIERVEDQACRCISTSAKRSLYLVDGYTVTHNTTMNLNRIFAWSAGRSLFPGWCNNDGEEYLRPEKPLRTLIAENEGNAGMFHQKCGLLLHQGPLNDAEKELALDNLYVHGDGGYSGLKLDNDEGVRKLRKSIEACKPDVVFVEPFRSLWRGEENSATDMALVVDNIVSMATDYGCAVILSHHERKSGPSDDGEKMSASRGSTVLEGVVAVMENFESAVGGDYREMTWSKARYLVPPPPVRMEWDRDTGWYVWVPQSAIEDSVLAAVSEAGDELLNLRGLSEETGETIAKLRPVMKRLEEEKRVKKAPSVATQEGSSGTRWRLPGENNESFGGLTL